MFRVKLGCSSRAHRKTAAVNSTPGLFTSGRRADLVIHLGAALALGFTLVASEARAGVPLPVVAQVASVPSLAVVVKEIAPSVVGIEASRSAAERRATSSCGSPSSA
jgi:hypothetical protein